MSRRDEQRVSITMTDFDMYCAARVERDKLKAENERLRGKLQEIVDKYHPDGNPMYLHDIAFEALQVATTP